MDVIERAGDQCFMPLTVGGGIRTLGHEHDAKGWRGKVSIALSAIANPPLIQEGAEKLTNASWLASISKRVRTWRVFTHGGRKAGLDAIDWAKEAVARGAERLC